jgi:hypothetical protein
MTLAFDEIIDFIVSRGPAKDLIAFEPSDSARRRVWDLIRREKEGGLTPGERSELESYMQLEHIMRLAKARARQKLANE